jgi:hypothetical protein
MTNTPSTLIFFGAAAIAALTLFAPQPEQTVPSADGRGRVVTVDDTGVNDNGQTSGDIFTQNAQDQSTANGAGT